MSAQNFVDQQAPIHELSAPNLAADERSRLADLIESRAMADMYAAAPPALAFRIDTIDGATLLIAPRLPVAYFNRVIGLGVTQPATEAALGAIITRFANAGVAEYWIHLNPAACPPELATWLAGRGFAPPPRRTWAKFLRGTEPYIQRPTELVVREAKAGDAHAIAQIVCTAYGMPGMLAPWFEALVGRPGWRFVLAERAGAVAATGAVFVDGERAWLGIGATLEQHRKLGAQSALLAARIALAAQAGCSVLSTETGEAVSGEPNPSLSNIRRAGFEQVCSRINLAPPKPGASSAASS
jgi:GNAT superfamily N-acetyltransferase